MKTQTTKMLFEFILLVSGMFSITAINAQDCPGNKVWACRFNASCDYECKCINANSVDNWLAHGTTACHCVYGCGIKLAEESDFENFISVYPNPVSSSTSISFSLNETQNVSLKIFDLSGRLITVIADAVFKEGDNEIE